MKKLFFIFILTVALLVSACSKSGSDSKEVKQVPIESPVIENSIVEPPAEIKGDKSISNPVAETISINQDDVETSLINALKLNKGVSDLERLGDSGKAIQAYIKKGIVNKKPNRRFDYTDYRLVKKNAKFMGHDLAVIEEEYMSEWVGCCVSEGAGVTVKVIGGTENLEKFAEENGCLFSDNVNLQQELIDVGIKAKVLPEHYASLSCRRRDMNSK
jgi:hypothetical protein